MTIMTVNVAGKNFIVDADNKGSAKAWGRNKLDVTVTESTGAEIQAFYMDGGTDIEKILPAAKKAPAAVEGAAAEGAEAAAE